MIETRAFKVLTPMVDLIESMDHICLGRKLPVRSVPTNLLPQSLSQPNKVSRYLIHSIPDYFFMMFNPQLVARLTTLIGSFWSRQLMTILSLLAHRESNTY